jgi:hypothetical protein
VPPRRGAPQDIATVVGIVWYRREDWPALGRLFVDAEELDDSYDDWLAQAESTFRQLESQGLIVEKVYMHPVVFADWCRERGLRPDADARSRFASEIARQRHSHQQNQ